MALDAEAERLARDRAAALYASLGHPQERWDALIERVQSQAIRNFSEVADEFLELLWCLDQYRVADAPPQGMGNLDKSFSSRINGVYRFKGNWFATLLSALLDNRTGEKIRSLTRIKGFSQLHQIDLAWPDRDYAPIVCAESKVTGGPAYRDYPERGAMADWTNRRKELKFSATDLKLSRREQTEQIGHWGNWRKRADPKCFMLWGARLRANDSIDKMAREADALLKTYLDGAGIFAWTVADNGSGYVPVAFPEHATVETIDNVLWNLEDEIAQAKKSGVVGNPVQLSAPVDPATLLTDKQ
jgi:hypothetical protein